MTAKKEEITLLGIVKSPGIVIGKAWSIDKKKIKAEKRYILKRNVDSEILRFAKAVEKSKKQLSTIKNELFGEEKKDHQYIIDAYLLMIDDPTLIENTTRNIKKERVNAEWALSMVVGELKQIFENIDNEYMRERSGDIDYVGDRILRNLIGESLDNLSGIQGKVIVVAHDLSPADTVQINKEKIIGFVTDIGGKTTHTAIIARAMEIPAVGGLEEVTERVETGDNLIIDGLAGKVIINPSKKTINEYLDKQQRYLYVEREIHKYSDLPAVTIDGKQIHIAGNIEIMEELPSLLSNGGEGIGLYRTEFLFMNRKSLPTEDEHFEVYTEVIQKVAPYPVTIRTLDAGADKLISFFDHPVELNPAMGLRSIRLCFKETDIFKTQLRAILRASAFGKTRIMFPMISGVEELRTAKITLEETKRELEKEGIPFDTNIQTGIMIEVPSAALIADLLAREVDFFSIGTNDLIQYSLAIDRANEHVAYLYDPFHPAILRVIKTIIDAAHNAGIVVGMCGEMAGDPTCTLLLLGMGLDELSMSAFSIPRVKKILRKISLEKAQIVSKKVLSLFTVEEIKHHLHEAVKNSFEGELWEEFYS